jgi:hypothetical protein
MSVTTISLKSYEVEGIKTTAVYKGGHSSGPPQGTFLDFHVVLTRLKGDDEWTAGIDFGDCKAESPQEALRRLAGWCRRAAECMDKDDDWWGENALPLGSDPI